MCNTCSTTSTHQPEPQTRRRVSWRLTIVLLALLAAAGYGMVIVPPAARQLQSDRREQHLATVGPLAEEIERAMADGYDDHAALLTEMAPPLFEADPNLAYLRLRGVDGQPVGAVARPPADARAALQAIGRARAQEHRGQWLETVAQLQQLQTEQTDLSELLDRAITGNRFDSGTRSGLYTLQDTTLQLAQSLQQAHPRLTPAVDSMSEALQALTREDEDGRQALEASHDAEGPLTLALEEFRTTFDVLPALPTSLAAAAPRATSWARLWPGVAGQRALTPLFVPAITDAMIAPAGLLEVGFYERPGELLNTLGARALPVPALLVVALLALVWPRRRSAPQLSASNTIP